MLQNQSPKTYQPQYLAQGACQATVSSTMEKSSQKGQGSGRWRFGFFNCSSLTLKKVKS